MKEKKDEYDPLDHVLKQLNDVLALAKKHAGQPISIEKVPSDIEETIGAFEEKLDHFRQETERLNNDWGIEYRRLRTIIDQIPEELPKKSQETLQTLKKMKKEAEEVYEQAKSGREEVAKKKLEQRDKKFPKSARKNKFRQLGDSDWQKM